MGLAEPAGTALAMAGAGQPSVWAGAGGKAVVVVWGGDPIGAGDTSVEGMADCKGPGSSVEALICSPRSDYADRSRAVALQPCAVRQPAGIWAILPNAG